jgi:predicted dehydrogenase
VWDTDKFILSKFHQRHTHVQVCHSEAEILESSNIDALYIASPAPYHYSQSIAALKSGKHILCEVPIIQKIDQGLDLLKVASDKNLICMMAENYCFTPNALALKKLFDDDYFGEITYLRSSYIHDCKSLAFNEDNMSLTWRGEARTTLSGNDYPTHSIGPISKWLGIGNGDDDYKSITSFASQEAALTAYMKTMVATKSPQHANFNGFKRGDISLSVIKTRKDILVELLLDTVSSRPSSMADLYIQGLNGSFISGRFDDESPILFRNKATFSKASRFRNFDAAEMMTKDDKASWRLLGRLFPLYKVIEDFVLALHGTKKPYITNSDGVLWSSIIELSKRSMMDSSREVLFPENLKL